MCCYSKQKFDMLRHIQRGERVADKVQQQMDICTALDIL